jgi:hypothetical protein
VLGAQLAMVGDGVKLPLLQKFAIVAIETVGGCFTFTVLEILALPHELVMVNFIVYVPGVTKLNDGCSELELEPPVKLQEPLPVPQNPEAYVTSHKKVGGDGQLLEALVPLVALTAKGPQPSCVSSVNAGVKTVGSTQMV